MYTAQEINNRGTRSHGWSIRYARHAHQPRSGLNGDIHRQVIPIRTRQTETGASAVNKFGIDLMQDRPANAQAVHHTRGEVFDHDVGFFNHLFKQGDTTG